VSREPSLDEEQILSALQVDSIPQDLADLLDRVDMGATIRRGVPSYPGVPVDRFEAMSGLGSGGYGCVLEAWDPKLGRTVALKLCISDRPDAGKLLMAEAQTLARLSHPNIITVYDAGMYEDRLFLVMEYAEQGSLTQRVQDRATAKSPMSWRELVPIFISVAKALAAAHEAGVVHGDVKPSNILLHADGWPWLADFGLARVIGATTLIPNAIGTRTFAAPELFRGRAMTPLSDQWSFFVALWTCLERRNPFIDTLAHQLRALTDDGMLELIEQWAKGERTPQTDMPEALVEIMRVGLSLEPGARFPDMKAVAAALTQFMAKELAAKQVKLTPSMTRREKLLRGVGISVAVLAAAGVLWAEFHLVERRRQDADSSHAEPQHANTKRADEQASLAARGEERLMTALEAAEALEHSADNDDMLDLFEAWFEGWAVLRREDPRLASSLTLQIAEEIDARVPGQQLPARLAERAAEVLQDLEDWDAAKQAQERAVEYYQTAGAPEPLSEAQECLADLKSKQRCVPKR